jgi:hypothetical protein
MRRRLLAIAAAASAAMLVSLLALTIVSFRRAPAYYENGYWPEADPSRFERFHNEVTVSRGGLFIGIARDVRDVDNVLPQMREPLTACTWRRKPNEYPPRDKATTPAPLRALGFGWGSYGGPTGGEDVHLKITIPMWFVMLPFAILPARWSTARRRERAKRRRAASNCCTSCGYDLRASGGRCPECGMAVSAP